MDNTESNRDQQRDDGNGNDSEFFHDDTLIVEVCGFWIFLVNIEIDVKLDQLGSVQLGEIEKFSEASFIFWDFCEFSSKFGRNLF